MFIDAAAPQAGLLDEALVLVGEQVRLDLGHGVERDRHDDQEAGTAEVERHAAAGDQQLRQDAHRREIERADHGQAVQDVFEIFGGVLAGPNARHEAAVLLQVLGGVGRVEHHGRVEEAEEHDQADIGQEIERRAVRQIGGKELGDAAARRPWPWNEAMVAGNSSSEEAKIGGMTPEVLILSGRCEASPPYMRLPTWRLGYCTHNSSLRGLDEDHDRHHDQTPTASAMMNSADKAPVRPSSRVCTSALGSAATMPEQMDQRHAVADAARGDLLADPHQQQRAADQGDDGDEAEEQAGVMHDRRVWLSSPTAMP